MSVVWLGSRLVLAAVFGVAGAAKLVDLAGSRQAMRDFEVPQRLVWPVGTLLPFAELAVAATLMVSGLARWAGLGALVLLCGFIVAMTVALARGRTPDCHCFGQVQSRPVGVATVARNVLLVGLAALVVWHPVGRVTDVGLLGLAVAAAFIAQSWFCFQLLRQNGRVLVRLSEVERSLAAPNTAKPQPGSPAPYFALSALDGVQVTLDSLLAGGRALVLAFVDPACGPCAALLPQLGAWQRELAGRLGVAVISGGDAAVSERQANEAGVEMMLLQPGRALSDLYGITETPSAVLIDPKGVIAQPPAVGAGAIAELVSSSPLPTPIEVSSSRDAGSAGADMHARVNGSAREGAATATAAVVGGVAAVMAGIGVAAPVAEAADPERAAIRAKIDAAEPHLYTHVREIRKASKRLAVLKPTSAARTATIRAIDHARKDLRDLRHAIQNSPASTPLAVGARGLVLSTLSLYEQAFLKLEQAARTRNPSRSLRAVKAARKLFDQALQRSIDAQASLTRL